MAGLNMTLNLKVLSAPKVRPSVYRCSATEFKVCVVLSCCGVNTSFVSTFSARRASGNARDRRRARRRTDRAIAILIAKHGAAVSEGSWVR